MLEVAQIREHKDAYAIALLKRNIDDAATLLDKVIEADDLRRSSQAKNSRP